MDAQQTLKSSLNVQNSWSYGNLRQWQTVAFDDFNNITPQSEIAKLLNQESQLTLDNTLNGYTFTTQFGSLYTCNNRQVVWSEVCRTTYAQKSYQNLSENHTQLRLMLSVTFLDRWQDENFIVKIDDKIVYQYSHNWCRKPFQSRCLENGINVCGVEEYPDRVGHLIKVEVPHSKSYINVQFGAEFTNGKCLDASWAVEYIQIDLK
eukprot:403346074